MLRALLRRLGLGRDPAQLELVLERAPSRRRRSHDVARGEMMTESEVPDAMLVLGGGPRTPRTPPAAPRDAAERALLDTLNARGLRGISRLRLTTNRVTVASFTGDSLRLHEAFTQADDDTLRAVVVFVCGRGAARRAAKHEILAYPIPAARRTGQRRVRPHPDDAGIAQHLTLEHQRLNEAHFGGTLSSIVIAVSRRMRSRLGHYAPAANHAGAEIALSRRHIRRDGLTHAADTLLHEMVHQWQDESGLPIDHGALFRRKAREVGVPPRASRTLRSSAERMSKRPVSG